ncbi:MULTISPECIES: maleylacetoacetate isomerase [unclassified Sphingopyxis]|uniref:maleylacetoacetate isomerase n=1 Tax=Sphingopyxis sp. GW247-27LB TaxID=2012632 RepID=UPI000BA51BB1|nr:maleylacetoacetate isomerase [Sphingopyxis sp. GW247-27LB]PAL23142.1 maleylacetoacetate isomerase [Sphingopyxis sp. GW247-27LB]
MLKLYEFFRSSASYRVRIGLNLKGLDYTSCPVNFRKDEQMSEPFTSLNPAKLVPVLETGDGWSLAQSAAILEYLDEVYPEKPLLPRDDPKDRAFVRQCALAVACDIHPLNNLRVLKYLVGPLGLSDETKNEWVRHWICEGFEALEAIISAHNGQQARFCFGDAPTLADCCLIPQIYNARRFEVDMAQFPILERIDKNCGALEAFAKAHPDAVA